MNPNLFFWNVRGLNEQDKHRPFVQWLSVHKPLIGAILESHIKEPNLNSLLLRVCPDWSFVSNHDTDADGRIIIIWKHPATVQMMHQTRQSITCSVTIPSLPAIMFTAVYAANTREERCTLWDDLHEVQSTLFLENRNWIIGGDFNQITHHEEHSSAAVDHLTTDMIEMKDHLLSSGVSDLRFQGSSHTWTNKTPTMPITKKLDRALVNDLWIESFPDSIATFLPHEFSDHTPCLLTLSCPLPTPGTRPFKFFNFLTTHPSFLRIVEIAWIQNGSRATDLSHLGYSHWTAHLLRHFRLKKK
ncbi:BnaCnng69440D [Brassica napus]|uniref:BnaCnng69440D protein n=1 Tax=Brassica napus TaxID=3708 RepID=A0A078JW85_BRANA|nr:BnaCnng69440D [Brassica napus]